MLIVGLTILPNLNLSFHCKGYKEIANRPVFSDLVGFLCMSLCALIRNLFRNPLPAVCVAVGIERSVGIIVIVKACNKAVSYNFHHSS